MATKRRKPAVESRVGHARAAKPKSPLDDFGKWAAEQGSKAFSKKEILHIKKFARGIGWSGPFEKSGIGDALEKAVIKNPKDKYTRQQLNRFYDKADKYARTYGDSQGPHQRFFKDADSGRAKVSEFNKRANSAFNAEVEIGRKQGKKSAATTKSYLNKNKNKKKGAK